MPQPGQQHCHSAAAAAQKGIHPNRRRVSLAHICRELCLVSAALLIARWDPEDGSRGCGTQINHGIQIPTMKHYRPEHLCHSRVTVPLHPHSNTPLLSPLPCLVTSLILGVMQQVFNYQRQGLMAFVCQQGAVWCSLAPGASSAASQTPSLITGAFTNVV